MSISFRQKSLNSAFCINNNLINDYFSQKITNFDKCTNNNIRTDIKLDEYTILDLINSCSCEKTKEKLSNLYANHIQKSVAINEAMKMYLGLNANEATVLGAIYIPTAKSGRGYITNKMIMYSTGLSKSTIKRALRKFERIGLIETTYQRDSINKMKVIRNYTFTELFYISAKATGCYTIQTPEIEDSGELHEMATKPIGTQGSKWTIKNNIYTSITNSNSKLLLVSNNNKVNNKELVNTRSSINVNNKNLVDTSSNTHVYNKELVDTKSRVNTRVIEKQEYSFINKEKTSMIEKNKYKTESYDQIIEGFVRKNYQESHDTIISSLKRMLKVWYGTYRIKPHTKKLKLNNFELKSKLAQLLELSKGKSTLAKQIIKQSLKKHYTNFYPVSMRNALVLNDKVINRVTRVCENQAKSTRSEQIIEEAYSLMDLALSMESSWAKSKREAINKHKINVNNSLINNKPYVYIDCINDINKTPIDEWDYIQDKIQVYGSDYKNQYKPNRLTKKGSLSIEELAVKVDRTDRAFNLDGEVQDTENPAQSVGIRPSKGNQLDYEYSSDKTPTPICESPLPQKTCDFRPILSPLANKSGGGGEIILEDHFKGAGGEILGKNQNCEEENYYDVDAAIEEAMNSPLGFAEQMLSIREKCITLKVRYGNKFKTREIIQKLGSAVMYEDLNHEVGLELLDEVKIALNEEERRLKAEEKARLKAEKAKLQKTKDPFDVEYSHLCCEIAKKSLTGEGGKFTKIQQNLEKVSELKQKDIVKAKALFEETRRLYEEIVKANVPESLTNGALNNSDYQKLKNDDSLTWEEKMSIVIKATKERIAQTEGSG